MARQSQPQPQWSPGPGPRGQAWSAHHQGGLRTPGPAGQGDRAAEEGETGQQRLGGNGK